MRVTCITFDYHLTFYYTHKHTCTHTHTHTHTRMHTHAYAQTCTHTYTFIHMHTQTYLSLKLLLEYIAINKLPLQNKRKKKHMNTEMYDYMELHNDRETRVGRY